MQTGRVTAKRMTKTKCFIGLVLGHIRYEGLEGLRCDPRDGVVCPSMKPGTAAQFLGVFCALPSLEMNSDLAGTKKPGCMCNQASFVTL